MYRIYIYTYISADPVGVWGFKFDSFRAKRKQSDSKAKQFKSETIRKRQFKIRKQRGVECEAK